MTTQTPWQATTDARIDAFTDLAMRTVTHTTPGRMLPGMQVLTRLDGRPARANDGAAIVRTFADSYGDPLGRRLTLEFTDGTRVDVSKSVRYRVEQ